MSLYFKVQSLSVMLPCYCASGEFPHRSDDNTDACCWFACTLATSAHLQVWPILMMSVFSFCFNQCAAADRTTFLEVKDAGIARRKRQKQSGKIRYILEPAIIIIINIILIVVNKLQILTSTKSTKPLPLRSLAIAEFMLITSHFICMSWGLWCHQSYGLQASPSFLTGNNTCSAVNLTLMMSIPPWPD